MTPQDINDESGASAGANVVPTLLMRARLLQLRGQYDEAIALCADAIRRAPRSASGHSLLGDVFQAQGKIDEALHCYSMAVDLAPTNTEDRAKLDRVVKIKQDALRSQRKQSELEAKRAPRAKGERTLEWFDRIFPPGRPRTIPALLFAFGAVIALSLGAAFGLVLLGTRGDNAARSTEPAAVSSRATEPVAVATPTPDRRSPGGGVSETPTVSESGRGPSVATGPTGDKLATPGPGASGPNSLAPNRTLSPLALPLPGVQAWLSPSTGETVVAFSVSLLPGERNDDLRRRILQSALVCAQAAFKSPSATRKVLVRGTLREGNTETLCFEGEADPTLAARIDVSAADIDALNAALPRQRWAAFLQ